MAPKRKKQDKDTDPSFVRSLGNFETLHVAIADRFKGLDSCVLVSARYTTGGGSVLDKSTLYPALTKVILQEHALCVYVDGHRTNRPFLRRLDTINLSEVVRFAEDAVDTATAMETELNIPLKEGGPIWRLVVLKDNTVIFAFDHSITDGQSGRAFHISLLAALNDLPPQSALPSDVKEIVEVPKEITLYPAIEDLLNTRVRFRTMVRELWDIFAPPALSKHSKTWSGKPFPIPGSADLSTTVHLLYFVPGQVEVLRRVAREHSATITSILHTIAVLVISRLIAASSTKDKKAKKLKGVFTYCPISLRRYTGAPPTAICEQVSSYGSHRRLIKLPNTTAKEKDKGMAAEFPWVEAARYTSELRAYTPKSPEQLGLMRFIKDDYDGFLQGLQGKKRRAALELSNIGPYPLDAPKGAEEGEAGEGEAARWGIGETFFAQADVVMGAALKLNVMGSPTGGLGISVTWSASSVEEGFARSFADGVEGALLELAGTKGQ